MKNILSKVLSFIESGNSKGIPVPLIRDPKTGKGSVSFSFAFLSFNLCFFGLIGKVTKLLGDIDMTNALWFFGTCASLYFGRTITRDGNKVSVAGKDENGQ